MRLNERVPRGPDGLPIRAKGNSDCVGSVDIFGTPDVKVPNEKQLYKDFDPVDEADDVADEVAAEVRTNDRRATAAAFKPIRSMLARHGAVLAAVCGPEVVDELAALVGGILR